MEEADNSFKLILCCGVTLCPTVGVLLSRWCQPIKARKHLDPPSHLEPSSRRPAHAESHGASNFLRDEVLSEQLARNIAFFGPDSQQNIADAFVIVVGLGGVGSHAATMLLRSGVGKLRLIDFDQVTLSSLNRHAVATREDVGTPKALCLEKHFKLITPEAKLECLVEMYVEESEERLLGGRPDFVLDAIDNLDTKASLIAACKRRGLKILSVAGAGAKADPTRLRVVDMSEASMDPLARAVRQKLRTAHNVWGGVPVLLSLEKPRCKLVTPEDVDETQLLNYQVIPNFRVRTIPALGTSPSIFGMAAASYVLCHLAGPSHVWDGEPITRPISKEYDRLLRELRDREVERFGEVSFPRCLISWFFFNSAAWLPLGYCLGHD